jgi:hypothetical protein
MPWGLIRPSGMHDHASGHIPEDTASQAVGSELRRITYSLPLCQSNIPLRQNHELRQEN